jgi:DNA mismatch endonuclease (patch repair protein)
MMAPDSESADLLPQGSWASSSGTRSSMRSNRARDTTPELQVRRRLHAMGLRYRVSARPEPGLRRTADILFRPTRLAVFIDGCFWHGCPEHYSIPATNAEFWAAKRTRNRERDDETNAMLEAAGWRVLRFWEHEVKASPASVAIAVASHVRPISDVRAERVSSRPDFS